MGRRWARKAQTQKTSISEEVHQLLEIQELSVSFRTYGGEVQAVRRVSFDVGAGEVVALVGESGCGKSVTAQSVMGLVPSPPGMIKGGSIRLNGRELIGLKEREWEQVRGKEIGMIFQDPMTSLNPTMPVGRQIAEGLRKHEGLSRTEAADKAMEMLELVGIPEPKRRMTQYPHAFSGGMRQRVMIAIALACRPKLLIADEPTTALDVTIQAQMIELMLDLKERLGTAILLITHDLGVVAGAADRIVVLYAGKVVERGCLDDIFYHSVHPYTWGLLQSIPRLDAAKKSTLQPIPGMPPDLFTPPRGCAFAKRCPYVMQICVERQPEMTEVTKGHLCACWLLDKNAPRVNRPIVTHENRD